MTEKYLIFLIKYTYVYIDSMYLNYSDILRKTDKVGSHDREFVRKFCNKLFSLQLYAPLL